MLTNEQLKAQHDPDFRYVAPAHHHYDMMKAALREIGEKAATMENGGAWAAGIAVLCLASVE